MMQTRCPACGTSFRVTPEQLKLRQGRVRCGRCHFVFNALESLVVDEGAAGLAATESGKAAAPKRSAPEPAGAAPAAAAVMAKTAPQPAKPEPQPAALAPSAVAAKPAVAPRPPAVAPSPAAASQPTPAKPAVAAQPATAPEAPAVVPEPIATSQPAPAPPAQPASSPAKGKAPPPWAVPDGEFSLTSVDEVVYATDTARAANNLEFELPEIPPLVFPHTMAEPEPVLHEAPQPRSWPWALGSLVALLLLAAQAVFVYRVEITAARPDLRPLLADACAQIGCDLPLPQQIRQIDIEASDLNPDPAVKARLRLTATLKNRAPFAQQLPDLELTLTDTLDRPLASRVLTPEDYLPAKREAAAGFAAREDLAISVPIEVSGTPASGYRLYLFYP